MVTNIQTNTSFQINYPFNDGISSQKTSSRTLPFCPEGLSDTALRLLSLLYECYKKNKDIHFAQQTMADALGVCRETVNRLTTYLHRLGLICKFLRAPRGVRVPCGYVVSYKVKNYLYSLGISPINWPSFTAPKDRGMENVTLLSYNGVYLFKFLKACLFSECMCSLLPHATTRNMWIVRGSEMQDKNMSIIPGLVLTEQEAQEVAQYPADAIEHLKKKIHLLKDPRNPMRWIRVVCDNYLTTKSTKTTRTPEHTFEAKEQNSQEYHKREEASAFPPRAERTVVGEYYRYFLCRETPGWKATEEILIRTKQPIPNNPFEGRMVAEGLSLDIDPAVMAALRWQEYLAHKDGNSVCGYCMYDAAKKKYKDCHFFPLVKDTDWVTSAYREYARYHLNTDQTVKSQQEEKKSVVMDNQQPPEEKDSSWVKIGFGGKSLPF